MSHKRFPIYLVLCFVLVFPLGPEFHVFAADSSGIAVRILTVGSLGTNCYILKNLDTQEIYIIDPGARGDLILKTVKDWGGKIAGVLLTHAHEDHLGAISELRAALPFKVLLHKADRDMASTNGVSGDQHFVDQETLSGISFPIKVIWVPGHSNGSVAFFLDSKVRVQPSQGKEETASRILFSGDILFAKAIGRTWERGAQEKMLAGIREKILPMSDDVLVCPGHGPTINLKELRPWLKETFGIESE